VYFTKISLDLNGLFRVQAMREVELQINTSYKKETCFSHFQICAIAVSAIEGLGIEFFVYFVEVIFLIVDLVHVGLLWLHHIAFSWCSLIYIYAEHIILVKFFHNTAESSKRIKPFNDCASHYSDSKFFCYNLPATSATEVFKPSTDAESHLGSIKKKIF